MIFFSYYFLSILNTKCIIIIATLLWKMFYCLHADSWWSTEDRVPYTFCGNQDWPIFFCWKQDQHTLLIAIRDFKFLWPPESIFLLYVIRKWKQIFDVIRECILSCVISVYFLLSVSIVLLRFNFLWSKVTGFRVYMCW